MLTPLARLPRRHALVLPCPYRPEPFLVRMLSHVRPQVDVPSTTSAAVASIMRGLERERERMLVSASLPTRSCRIRISAAFALWPPG